MKRGLDNSAVVSVQVACLPQQDLHNQSCVGKGLGLPGIVKGGQNLLPSRKDAVYFEAPE